MIKYTKDNVFFIQRSDMMKKILFAILVIAMAFNMTSCTKEDLPSPKEGALHPKTSSDFNNWAKIVEKNEINIGVPNIGKSFCNDLIDEFEKELNISVNKVAVNGDFKDALSKGDIDMYWGLYPKEAQDSFDYTVSSPYLTTTAVLLTLSGKDEVSSVGVLKNSAEEKLAKGKYETIKAYSSLSELWAALGYKKTDAILINNCDWEKSDYVNSKLYSIKDTTMYNLVIAFKDGYTDLATEIDKTLAKIKASGVASEISVHWYGKDLISK